MASPTQWTGNSTKFSFEEAFQDAISKAPTDIPTDDFKYLVKEIGYEKGGFMEVNNLFVTIERVENK